jgi:hypothetical protein
MVIIAVISSVSFDLLASLLRRETVTTFFRKAPPRYYMRAPASEAVKLNPRVLERCELAATSLIIRV